MNVFGTVLMGCLAAVALLALLVAGEMDYQDELAQERLYVELVCEGTWPDYQGLEPDCK